MVDANNIDLRTLFLAQFAGLLAPAIDSGIGAMDSRAFTRLIKHAAMIFVMGKAKLDGGFGVATRLPMIFDMPTA
jgi:hypothetical protein